MKVVLVTIMLLSGRELEREVPSMEACAGRAAMERSDLMTIPEDKRPKMRFECRVKP